MLPRDPPRGVVYGNSSKVGRSEDDDGISFYSEDEDKNSLFDGPYEEDEEQELTMGRDDDPTGMDDVDENCDWESRDINMDSEVADSAGLELSFGDYRQVKSTHSVDNRTNSLQQLDTLIAVCNFNIKPCCSCSHECDCDKEPVKEWLIDSGASAHFTKDMNDYVEYESIDNGPYVTTANSHAQIKGKGTIILLLSTGEVVRISPVYYIPTLNV
jgi:hypothetical protein